MQFSTLKIAWRNLGRNKKRTALAVLAIAVGQFALLATSGLMRGYADNIRLAITGPMIGHVQVHARNWREERALDLAIEQVSETAAAIGADEAVDSVSPRIYGPVLAAPQEEAHTAVVVGVETEIESQTYGLLSGLDELLQGGQVLVGYRLARKMGIQRGDEIALVGQGADGSLANDLFVVQDIINCPADLVNQLGVVMQLAAAQELFVMPDAAHEMVIRTVKAGQAEALAERLQALEVLAGREVNPWGEIVPEFVMMLDMADWVGYFVLVLVFIAAVAGIANTLMMSVFERMREFGMLLALGSRPGRIVGMILIEAVLTGILGATVGSLLGYGFVQYTAEGGIDMASWSRSGGVEEMAYKGLQLPLHVFPRLELFDSILGLTAVIVTALVASTWPSWIAARLEPMEAMRA